MKIATLILIIVTFMTILHLASLNDKVSDNYWESQRTECRARGSNFDLIEGVCVQSHYE